MGSKLCLPLPRLCHKGRACPTTLLSPLHTGILIIPALRRMGWELLELESGSGGWICKTGLEISLNQNGHWIQSRAQKERRESKKKRNEKEKKKKKIVKRYKTGTLNGREPNWSMVVVVNGLGLLVKSG